MDKNVWDLCMISCIFQNTLELEPHISLEDMFLPIVFIHNSIQFSLQTRFDNTLLDHIFISCIFHVSFTLLHKVWVINVVNRAICILLEQHFKTIIFIIIVFIGGLIQESRTEMYLLQSIYNRIDFGIVGNHRITITCINSMYALFGSQWYVIQLLIIVCKHQKTLDR